MGISQLLSFSDLRPGWEQGVAFRAAQWLGVHGRLGRRH
jgi:hypothetical protein